MSFPRAQSRLRRVMDHFHLDVSAQNTSAKQSDKAPLLNAEQLDFYEKNGFIVIPNLVTPEQVEFYNTHFLALCDGKVERPPTMTVMRDVAAKGTEKKGERAITKFQDFMDEDGLFSYCALPQILDYVQEFIGPNLKAMHTMFINKPPDLGRQTSRHPLHQDLHYFPFRPANKIVCAWTALQRIDRENGCLVALPGSHKGELLEHDYPDWEGGVNKAYHGVKGIGADSRRVYLEMNAGDTVFFHPILIHGSGANRTEGFRKAISCHYASADCFYVDVTGTSQETIAKEIEEMAGRKGIEGMSFQDVWRWKGRLVRGQEITL
eukprot:TRINITY_DN21_c0_g1_i1.p1 TRINITY_DN21_c0_g1~~TRINITY_DN21_c0_g1_i1.p1  ORF type:complete len:321 (-),score=70.49 TRINITY_DN21_c0_g1_i1:230-1192(-)